LDKIFLGLITTVPVASSETCRELRKLADAVVCLETPDKFFGVGQYYHDFDQTTDEEAIRLLGRQSQ
jgi:predicted phosphoribosyltransferase